MTKKTLPLRILNTRPIHQAKKLTSALESHGFISIECPSLEIVPIVSEKNMPPSLNTINTAIFISPNAVNFYFEQLNRDKISWPSTINVLSIGKSTAQTLAQHGIQESLLPSESTSESLLTLPILSQVKNHHILLIKGKEGRDTIESELRQRGAIVHDMILYERKLPKYNHKNLNRLWREDAVDIILFTSKQGMQSIFTMFGKKAHPWLCSKPCLVLSQRLAEEAARLGVKKVIIAKPELMIETLKHINEGLTNGK